MFLRFIFIRSFSRLSSACMILAWVSKGSCRFGDTNDYRNVIAGKLYDADILLEGTYV